MAVAFSSFGCLVCCLTFPFFLFFLFFFFCDPVACCAGATGTTRTVRQPWRPKANMITDLFPCLFPACSACERSPTGPASGMSSSKKKKSERESTRGRTSAGHVLTLFLLLSLSLSFLQLLPERVPRSAWRRAWLVFCHAPCFPVILTRVAVACCRYLRGAAVPAPPWAGVQSAH
jgi:hypothetical protein